MATVQQITPATAPLEAEPTADGRVNASQILLTWKKLCGSPTTSRMKYLAIQRMYQRLAAHYMREINELHMRTYPEGLLDLPVDLLPLAFEKVIQTARFFPSIEEIRAAVASDNAAQIEELWRRDWMTLLPAIKKHGRTWRSYTRIDLEEPRKPKQITVEAPQLSVAMTKALQTLGGSDDWRDGIAFVQGHPFFYGSQPGDFPGPDSPRLAADRIEKRVRDLWEVYR